MPTILSLQRLRFFPVVICLALLALSSEPLRLLAEYSGFLLLGIIGALFANSTGAGGGVIFVPFFQHLQLSTDTIVATSFAIQCCGMTAGAMTWWAHYRHTLSEDDCWRPTNKTLGLTIAPAMLGVAVTHYGQTLYPLLAVNEILHTVFGVFSVCLAIMIFASVRYSTTADEKLSLEIMDQKILPLIAFSGGIITAFLSVGVGELLAVYLIVRGFNATFAIAVAVIVSAFSVWVGGLYYALFTEAIYWPVVIFAGVGAVLGGAAAKYLTLYFSPANVKRFFAFWVLMLGLGSMTW